MSTRGTYKIYDDYNDLDVCFYIHSDNYAEGAALYFQKMLDYKETKKLPYAEAFFRANSEARFTKSHSYHVDTEYQYDILKKDKKYILEGFEVSRHPKYDVCPSEFPMTRKKFFGGSVEDFIKLYKEDLSITEKNMIDTLVGVTREEENKNVS